MCQCSPYLSRFKWPTERSCKEGSPTGSHVKAGFACRLTTKFHIGYKATIIVVVILWMLSNIYFIVFNCHYSRFSKGFAWCARILRCIFLAKSVWKSNVSVTFDNELSLWLQSLRNPFSAQIKDRSSQLDILYHMMPLSLLVVGYSSGCPAACLCEVQQRASVAAMTHWHFNNRSCSTRFHLLCFMWSPGV